VNFSNQPGGQGASSSAAPNAAAAATTPTPAAAAMPAAWNLQQQQSTAGTPAAAVNLAGASAAPPAAVPASTTAAPAASAAAVQEGVDASALCLLQKSSITCIYPSGEQLETPLLQPCTALWPLTSGVLLVVGDLAAARFVIWSTLCLVMLT
jgi:hypothetical protein